jgi:predicted glycoside hydrolase/deacetylase ChbG (UPF0249 family)
MAPCPVFPEAAQWAKSHKIPIGMHATFTAEWDFLRWKPLTGMKSMVLPDGTLHPTVEEAWKNADIQEAEKEFEAQWKAIESYGLKITYISEHMSFDSNGKMANLFIQKVKEKKVPYLSYTLDLKKHPISHTAFDTSFFTGYSTDLKTMKEKLKGWIESMKPGYHLWNCHCAVDHPSLDQLCKPGHVGFHWARTYRMIDQSLILDPEVRGWIEKRGIQRIPVSQCPVVGS